MPDAFYSIRGYSYSLLPSFHSLGKEVRFRLGTMVQTLKFPCITLFTNRNTKEKLSTEYTISEAHGSLSIHIKIHPVQTDITL